MRRAALRVIEVVPGVFEEASGPSYSVTRLCETLAAHGEQVCLAALNLGILRNPPPFLHTFELGAGPRRLGRSPAMNRWLQARATSRAVDIIHNHGMWQMNALYPAWAARRGGVPLVVSPRGAFSRFAMAQGSRMKRVFWPFLQRPALDVARCFHATVESEYEDIRRLGFRQPVAVIPNGIDIPSLPTLPAASARTLLFLGRIHAIKGLDMLLRSWRRVEDRFPEWQLVIVGSDQGYYGGSGYRGEMERLATKLQTRRVRFVGELKGNDKLAAMAQAELFVLPSYSENFGIAVAEALAAGTPAVVTKGAPWASLVERGAGWWPDTNEDGLTRALEDALRRSSAELEVMGMKGREWMQAEFSWERIGSMMSRTYGWIVHGGGVPAWVRVD
jgi:glycosyltransferase involved in cell wall biosynthesis